MSAYNAIMNLLPLLSKEEKLIFAKELNILPISEHSLIEKEKEFEHSKNEMYKKYNTLKQELQNESHLIKQKSIELIKKKQEQEEENKYLTKLRDTLDTTKKALEDYRLELDYEREQFKKEKINFQRLEEIYEKDRKETKELYHILINTDILTPHDISSFWIKMEDILNQLIKLKTNKVSIINDNYKYFLTINSENGIIKIKLPSLFKIKSDMN